jgi:AraC-like DNA-binding protein
MAAGIVEELGYTHTFPVCTFMDMDSIEKGISGIISRGGRDTSDVLWREGSFLHLIANLFDQADDREIYAQDDSGGVELRLGSRMYAAQAIHYLETRFREKIQIQQLAQDIGISRSYLTQLFKEEIGMSPRELLINIRMEHATECLEKSNDPIQLVALECGYDDALAFSKAFKQRFGMSPSRYRKEKQKAARI